EGARGGGGARSEPEAGPASTGRPARKNGSSTTPAIRPVSSPASVTTPTKGPAIRWITASQVLAETTARSTATGPTRPPLAAAAPGASLLATSGLTDSPYPARPPAPLPPSPPSPAPPPPPPP